MPIELFDSVSLTVEAALSAATGGNPILNSNPLFESGVDPWVPRNCTLDQSSVWAYQGAYSLRLTPDGVASSAYAESELDPVVAGVQYQALGNVWAPTAWGNVIIGIAWYGASGWMFTVEAPVSLAAGVATPLSCVATAPPAATHATVVLFLGSSPPASQVTYFDEVTLAAANIGYGAWDAGRWDSATWGPDEQWTDISAYVRSITSDRKFGNEVQSWDAGSAAFLLSNRDGRFSSDNLAGPYVVAGVSAIRPWRPFRWSATYDGVLYRGFTGYCDDWVDTWLPGHADAYVTVPCVDEMAALADVDGLEQAPQGAGEASGARIHRVLNSAGHTGLRNIAVGRTTVQATTLASNVSTELKLVADSEGGALFIDADGSVVFEDQYALLEQDRSRVIQATFGDGSGPELPCSDVTPTNTGKQVKNIVSYARVGSTAQTVVDPTSRALYRDKRKTRTDLVCETDAQALALATFDLEKYKQPAKRFSRIEVKPRANPALLFPKVLGLRVRDLIRVVARPLGSPPVIRDCHIAGIHHQISRDDWVTTFDLWDASVYQTYASSRWDVGRWDDAAWFF